MKGCRDGFRPCVDESICPDRVSRRFVARSIGGSSQLAVALVPAGCDSPGSAGAGPPYSTALVVGVTEAECDASDVFDDAVVAFAAGVSPVCKAAMIGACQVSMVRAKLITSGTVQGHCCRRCGPLSACGSAAAIPVPPRTPDER